MNRLLCASVSLSTNYREEDVLVIRGRAVKGTEPRKREVLSN
jgi:hypothetical protein